MITVKLRFFGPLRDKIEREEVEIQVKKGTKVEDLLWLLGERFPNIRENLKVVSFSVDNEYAPKGTALEDGNVVGVLPPISGGCDG